MRLGRRLLDLSILSSILLQPGCLQPDSTDETTEETTEETPAFGQALSFDSGDQYIQNNFTQGALARPYTVEFLIKPESVAGSQTLVTIETSGVNFSVTLEDGILKPRWPMNGCSGTAGTSSSTPIEAGKTYHVAVVVTDGPSMSFFLNGVIDASSTTSTGDCDEITSVITGAQAEGDDFTGIIDELRISASARYTVDFTAPTEPFQGDADTILLSHWNSSALEIDDTMAGFTIGSTTGTEPTLVDSPF